MLVEQVARGIPIETAALAVGISRGTYYEWMHAAEHGTWKSGVPADPESLTRIQRFSHKVMRARAECQARLIDSLYTAATTPNEKTGQPDWRAGDALMSKHPAYRKDWREERHTTIDQTTTVRLEDQLVQGKSVEELDALEQALAALPSANPPDETGAGPTDPPAL
jgi:transposase-like protein